MSTLHFRPVVQPPPPSFGAAAPQPPPSNFGPRSSGQGIRGPVTGAKFDVLQFEAFDKTYTLYAGMSRFGPVGVKDMEHTLVAHRSELEKLMKVIVKRRPDISSFKVYYKNLAFRGHGEMAIEIAVDKELVKPNKYETETSALLEKTYARVDFTLRSTERRGPANALLNTNIRKTKPLHAKLDAAAILKMDEEEEPEEDETPASKEGLDEKQDDETPASKEGLDE